MKLRKFWKDGQRRSTSLYWKYPPGHKFDGKRVLNLGCGYTRYMFPNVVNLDGYGDPDVLHDLEKTPLPFADESFDLILANHIVEHVRNWWSLFNDCARLLVPGGELRIWVPGSGTDAIFGFRDHVVEINDCSFFGTFGTHRAGGNSWADEQAACHANRLKKLKTYTYMEPDWWLNVGPEWWLKFCARHLRNTVREQGFVFVKVTDSEWADDQRNYAAHMANVKAAPKLNFGGKK